MDHKELLDILKNKGYLRIKEGNGKVLTFRTADSWNEKMGKNWVFLLFDIFQIRAVADQFSEVSLDIVDFASKPTIYHSPASPLIDSSLIENGTIRFALLRDKEWNRLLFQASRLMLVNWEEYGDVDVELKELFPLFSPNLKELYLNSEGDVKIIKG